MIKLRANRWTVEEVESVAKHWRERENGSNDQTPATKKTEMFQAMQQQQSQQQLLNIQMMMTQ